jgi:hypothetical protein
MSIKEDTKGQLVKWCHNKSNTNTDARKPCVSAGEMQKALRRMASQEKQHQR